MKRIFLNSKLDRLFTLGIIALFSSSISFAETAQETSIAKIKKVYLTMIGGFSHSEGTGGMIDLNLELQFNLSSYVRIGMGAGYLGGFDHMHMEGNFSILQGGMMGGFSGHNHDLRIIPLTLSLYYVLPVSPKLDVFMLGGGGYYLSSYKDQSTQNEGAFGPHVGWGIDVKLANRITLVAEGLYRFANLEGFTSELHEGFREGMEGEHENGFWHFHHHDDEWHFHEEHEAAEQMLREASSFDISLNGISLRVGVKFSF